ncbi:LuxR C-terminal-related transcriptional regulator [Paraburkholderia sp. A2RI-6]|jgi:DNA-binding CsgD family transcriptional regulator|uniref:helix-turn-helix transcriptional regulator n=1 Tax=Paraburkholderia sp. A2RI-6 TaxID=3028371 RepID=UPI003B77BFF8
MTQASDSRAPVLYEANVRIARDAVNLRLWGRGERSSALLLEHEISQYGGVTLSQLFAFEENTRLEEFCAADPYGEHLRSQYYTLTNILEQSNVTGREAGSAVMRSQAIDGVQDCTSESELYEFVSTVIQEVGGTSYLYRWIHIEEKTNDIINQRCLLGCHPGWMHKYFHRVWYMNDPILEYAKRSVSPATDRQLEVSEMHWSQIDAPKYGFVHVAVFPVHFRKGLIGVLQIAGSNAVAVEAMLEAPKRLLLRDLATELLSWEVRNIRNEAASAYRLTPREREVLRMVSAGGSAANVALSLGLSAKTVYRIYATIDRKLGVASITKSVAIATEKGLLE